MGAEQNTWAESGGKSTLDIELLEFGVSYKYAFISI